MSSLCFRSLRGDDPAYGALFDAQYEQIGDPDPEIGKKTLKHVYSDQVRGKLKDLFPRVGDAASEFSTSEITLLNQPMLLVDGDAGIGKSHLLANQVYAHIQCDYPALFIPSRVLDRGDRPEPDCYITLILATSDLRLYWPRSTAPHSRAAVQLSS